MDGEFIHLDWPTVVTPRTLAHAAVADAHQLKQLLNDAFDRVVIQNAIETLEAAMTRPNAAAVVAATAALRDQCLQCRQTIGAVARTTARAAP